jgi:heme oxygenase
MSNLPDLLRTATWPLHREVERSGLMRRILAGQIDRSRYVELLSNLSAIYRELESMLVCHAAHRWLASIHEPALHRTAALEADLRVLGSERSLALLPATLRYVDRLRALGRDSPQLLVAHAYVRYLGDLSGGQTVGRILGRALHLQPPDGLRFYDFGGPDAAAARALAFRQGLAAIDAKGEDADALVAEALLAFSMHAALFRELDAAQETGTHPAQTMD